MSFDFDRFASELKEAYHNKCVGYAFVISYKNEWKKKESGGKARTSANPPELNHATDVPFHLASVSKTISAVALLKLLVKRSDAGLHSVMHPFLPEHWHIDETMRQTTFFQLLTHTSGYKGVDVGYYSLKNYMAKGMSHPSTNNMYPYDYVNTNYALMRFLIPALANAPIKQKSHPDPIFEGLQAAEYATAYIKYVRDELFEKAGLSKINAVPPPFTGGYCYHFPYFGHGGTDFGDKTMEIGSQGWVMTAAQLAKFIRAVHFSEDVVSASIGEQMIKHSMGYNGGSTPAGHSLYWKGGLYPDKGNAGALHTMIAGFDNDVQIAVIMNSGMMGENNMQECVWNAYDKARKVTTFKFDMGDNKLHPK